VTLAAAAGEQSLLAVKDLHVRATRQRVDIVTGVSFTLERGSVLGLVGESGSGKTTTALAVLGYARRGLSISGGTVSFQGRDVLSMSPGELLDLRGGSIAYVAQDPASALNPALKVGHQLAEVFRIHQPEGQKRIGSDRLAALLTEVGLEHVPVVTESYPHQLSGGQQQRVMVAMAFACRPSVIVLDEPTTGLDVTTQRRVLDTVRSLCRSHGTGAIYVSHDLAVVADIADHVGVMYSGAMVEVGEATQVLGNPSHPYTQALLAAVPSHSRRERLRGIGGLPPQPGQRPSGCAFAPRCGFVQPACSEPVPLVARERGRLVRCVLPNGAESAQPAAAANERSDDLGPDAEQGVIATVRDLSASYGTVEVVKDVTLSLNRSTCLAVVGESGSGKTTFARCLVGMHSRWHGEITIDGRELPAALSRRSIDDVRRTQYIFQNPYGALNPRRTVEQLLDQPLKHFFTLSGTERGERIGETLAAVSLSGDMLDRYPGQLSGGERQRVAIARALVVEPRLLICDEVTSALDVSVQASVVELLRALQQSRRLTLLFITHNLPLVRAIADDVVVMSAGRIVERGSATDVLDRPQHEYTRELIANAPAVDFSGTRDGSTSR